jgi:uncharacterized membrane protein
VKSSKPKTPDSVKQLQARQIADLAELDEDENTRIKNLLIRRSGARAFRGSAAGRASAANAAAGGGSGRGGSIGGSGGFRGTSQKV